MEDKVTPEINYFQKVQHVRHVFKVMLCCPVYIFSSFMYKAQN